MTLTLAVESAPARLVSSQFTPADDPSVANAMAIARAAKGDGGPSFTDTNGAI